MAGTPGGGQAWEPAPYIGPPHPTGSVWEPTPTCVRWVLAFCARRCAIETTGEACHRPHKYAITHPHTMGGHAAACPYGGMDGRLVGKQNRDCSARLHRPGAGVLSSALRVLGSPACGRGCELAEPQPSPAGMRGALSCEMEHLIPLQWSTSPESLCRPEVRNAERPLPRPPG